MPPKLSNAEKKKRAEEKKRKAWERQERHKEVLAKRALYKAGVEERRKARLEAKQAKKVKKSTALVPVSATAITVSGREAPEERALAFRDIIQAVVTQKHFEVLRGKTPAYAIKYREGGGGQQLKYLPHGYVRDQLNKAFGFDWDFELMPIFGGQPFTLSAREEKNHGVMQTVSTVTVCGKMTVRVRNPKKLDDILTTIVKTEFGSQPWRDKMEFGDALKGASSDALKRCGLGLGIGLDLYYDDEAAEAKYNKRLADAAAADLVAEAEKVPWPITLPAFIADAASKYGFDAAKLCELLQLKNIMELANRFPADAEALWKQITPAPEVLTP